MYVVDRQLPSTLNAPDEQPPEEPVAPQPQSAAASDADNHLISVCSLRSGKFGTVDSRLFERYQPTEAPEADDKVDSGGRPSIMSWETSMVFVLMIMRMGWGIHDAAPLFGDALTTARR